MTVVRLPDGGVWIHSPVAADETLYGRGEALSAVAHLVAPNTLHWSYAADWQRRFPGATVHIVPGLEGKVAARRVIADAVTPWSAAIDTIGLLEAGHAVRGRDRSGWQVADRHAARAALSGAKPSPYRIRSAVRSAILLAWVTKA